MKYSKLYVVFSWFAFLAILLWMTSCASRKTQKNSTEATQQLTSKVEQKNDVSLIQTSNQITENVLVTAGTSIIETVTITPVDATKPTVVTDADGTTKTIQNGVYSSKKEKVDTNLKQNSKSIASDASKIVKKGSTKSDLSTKSKKQNTIKQTDRSTFSWWFLLLIIIPTALYVYWRIKT